MQSLPSFTPTSPRTYERIGHRLRDLISNPKVQRLQCVTVRRLANEDSGDWCRVISEISGTAGVKVEDLGDDAIRIAWSEYYDS